MRTLFLFTLISCTFLACSDIEEIDTKNKKFVEAYTTKIEHMSIPLTSEQKIILYATLNPSIVADTRVVHTFINLADIEMWAKQSNLLAVVFHAPWCGPCKQYLPIFDKVSNSRITDCTFGKLNIDEGEDAAKRFEIKVLPTTIFIQNGLIVAACAGVLSEGTLNGLINDYKVIK